MEIFAAIKGLQSLKYRCRVKLYSDSKYLVNAMVQNWAKRWKSNNWKRTKSEKVKNPDLWKTLLDLCEKHQVDFHWVKGHASNEWNNRCDELAVEATTAGELPVDQGYENCEEFADVEKHTLELF
jgi:ribonuclease HI